MKKNDSNYYDDFDETMSKVMKRLTAAPLSAVRLTEDIKPSLREKSKRRSTKKHEKPEPGDVLCVSRTFYKHYGIYAGNNKVIHYTSEKSDISLGGSNKIQKTSFSNFLRGRDHYYIVGFPEEHGKPRQNKLIRPPIINSSRSFKQGGSTLTNGLLNIFKKSPPQNYKLHSQMMTLIRAKSRLGEEKYRLAFNNCEHFVAWCKTGISESSQVKAVMGTLDILLKIPTR